MESLISLWLVRAEKHAEIVQRNSKRLRWYAMHHRSSVS
jgi:hypothetical protein